VSSSYDKLKRLIGREERKKNSQEAYQRKNPPKKPWCTDCERNGRNPKGGGPLLLQNVRKKDADYDYNKDELLTNW
jgi:hypothetical protein